MSKKDHTEAMRVREASEMIKAGLIRAVRLTEDDPALHYTALLIAVASYLDTWAELAGTNKITEVDKFADSLKEAIKGVRKIGN